MRNDSCCVLKTTLFFGFYYRGLLSAISGAAARAGIAIGTGSAVLHGTGIVTGYGILRDRSGAVVFRFCKGNA